VVMNLNQHALLVCFVLQVCSQLKDQVVKLVQTIPTHQIQELVHAHHADLVQKSTQLKRVVKYVNQDSSHRIMTCVRDAHQEASQQFVEQPNVIHANVVTESTLTKMVVTFVWLVGSQMADQLVNDVPITHIQQMTEHVNV
jgi:predicted PurR-regulated permease PerM